MAWVRKNAAPPSLADLKASASEVAAAIAHQKHEIASIEADLPSLVSDPRQQAEAEVALEKLRIEILVNERTLALIEAAIPDAEKRERLTDFLKRRDAQEKSSARLAQGLQKRHAAALAALLDVYQDVEADEAACRALAVEGRELGENGVWSAEFRVRKDIPAATRNGFSSITLAKIPAWSDAVHAWFR